MPRKSIYTPVYDASTRTLNLETMQRLIDEPNTVSDFKTPKLWFGYIFFEDSEWKFTSTLKGEDFESHSDPDIFVLIEKINNSPILA